MLNKIEVEMNVSEVSRFVKRLGPQQEGAATPRPLLIGFKNADHCKSILEKSPSLAQQDEPWSEINIIRDLTKNQRKEEKDLRVEAERKTSELSEEEKGNWKWKVVGRRGERKVVKVALNREEEEGERTDNMSQRGRGRGRGRGRPSTRNRRNLRQPQQ